MNIVAHVNGEKEAILNKNILDRIKRYILQSGQRETYCNMFNDNPHFSTEHYDFYLNPDPGGPVNHPQWNINCDLKKGDFNTLVIRTKDGSGADYRDQYRHITFLTKFDIQLEVYDADPDMPVSRIREFPERAIQEFLLLMEKGKKSPHTAP
jgi:hypothetical protein